jgi:hypothetical protein
LGGEYLELLRHEAHCIIRPVSARDAGLLRARLADPSVADVDPLTVERLRRLAAGDGPPLLVAEEPHGTLIVREPSPDGVPRRVLELDRAGAVLTVLRWTDDQRLAHAWTRITDDSWLMVEPRAAYAPPWGLCDRLWHAAHPSAAAHVPLTLFEALDYAAVDKIPVLLEPARLPAGAGAAVLNLLAALAVDAGRSRLPYRGPYPTEQLFVTLLESFRWCDGDGADPLAAFMAGRMAWRPAPHERACPAPGVTVSLRERIEKVVWRERVYYRPDWQGVNRHAPRRVRDEAGSVVCSLWALGEVIEDHLRLDPDGTRVDVIAPPPVVRPARQLPRPVMAGVASAAAAFGAAPLAPFVREIADRCELWWTTLDGDLVTVDRNRLGLSHTLRHTLHRRLQTTSTRADRLALALAALTELAHLCADPLRARAQSRLATLSLQAQTQILQAPPTDQGTGDARRIAEALDPLLEEIA